MERKIKWKKWCKKRILIVLVICIAAILFPIVKNFCREKENQRRQEVIAERGPVSIVVFGDSIWDLVRDDTGIEARLADKLSATVYNLAINGTNAAFRSEGEDLDKWNGETLFRLVQEVTGTGEAVIPVQEEAHELIHQIDYNEVDYFIIAYGLNDYFEAVPTEGEDPFDTYTYGGALRSAVVLLKETYPNAEIVLISQTYCQGYSYGKIDSDSNTKDYGGGFAPAYVETAERVAEEYDLIFINNYKKMGIHRYNGPKYLIDATHLTEYGRDKYAGIVADYLIEDYIRVNKEKAGN